MPHFKAKLLAQLPSCLEPQELDQDEQIHQATSNSQFHQTVETISLDRFLAENITFTLSRIIRGPEVSDDRFL